MHKFKRHALQRNLVNLIKCEKAVHGAGLLWNNFPYDLNNQENRKPGHHLKNGNLEHHLERG